MERNLRLIDQDQRIRLIAEQQVVNLNEDMLLSARQALCTKEFSTSGSKGETLVLAKNHYLEFQAVPSH